MYALSCISNITNTYVQPDNGHNSERNTQLLIMYDKVHLTGVHLFMYYIH